MGMFDWVHCDYPMPNGYKHQKQSEYDAAPCQTKDLDNGCNVYRITGDGRLFFEEYGNWTEDRTGQYLEHTGKVSIYDDFAIGHTFTLTFENGLVIDVVEGWGDDPVEQVPLTADQVDELVAETLPMLNRRIYPPMIGPN